MHSFARVMAGLVVCVAAAIALQAQQPPPPAGSDPLHRPLDQILDVNVRDGLVYYRALQSSRHR
jgi:type IV secretory pathway VirB2 component (pilin)